MLDVGVSESSSHVWPVYGGGVFTMLSDDALSPVVALRYFSG